MLKSNGWYEVKQTGSHIHFYHDENSQLLVIPYHASKDLGTGLTNKLLKQAGLK